jgi:hypothetical protein
MLLYPLEDFWLSLQLLGVVTVIMPKLLQNVLVNNPNILVINLQKLQQLEEHGL